MKVWWAMLALLCAVPASAQDQPPAAPDVASMSDDELLAQVQEARTRRNITQCVYAAMTTELARRNPETWDVNTIRLDKASCHATRGEFASAVALLEEIDASAPRNRLERFGVYVSTMARDGQKTLKYLRRTVQFGSLPEMMQREPDGMMSAFRLLMTDGLKQEHDALCNDITRADWFDDLDFDLQNWCAFAAIRHGIEQGKLSRIGGLLDYIRNPDAYISMLASRDFEVGWPQIEEHAGEHVEKVTSSFVSWTAQHLADKPDDRDRLSLYAQALLYAGRDEEAAVLAGNWLAGAAGAHATQEGDGWALNAEVMALDALGQTDEADAVFDGLVATSPAKPWMVNFLINRAARLMDQRRWSEALEAYDLARPMADATGTDYARLLVAKGRACTLHNLGRDPEAEPEIAYLIEHTSDYAPVAASGLLCVDRRADAERLIAEAFMRDDGALTFIDIIQEDRFDPSFARPTSDLPGVRELILGREDWRSKMLERVRLLPDNLVPIGYLRRQERRSASSETH